MNLTRSLRFAPVLLLVLAVAIPAAAQGPSKIGELELIDIGTADPYPIGFGDNARTWEVAFPGASYIRVHFSKFDLAPGDFVEIMNPAGTEHYRFTGKGPHDNGHFWASTIIGDTAVIRLQAFNGGGAGFEVDSFGRGTEPGVFDPIDPEVPSEPESVCGITDWQDVKCYEGTYPTEFENARAAVKAIIGCCSSCTAFKISDSGQFMTNNHCTSSQSGVQSTELRFEFQANSCGSGSSGFSGSVMGQDLVATGYTLDYTLMTSDGPSSIPCLSMDDRLPPAGERIYIAGHPSGGVKKLSLESTHSSNPSGFCEVDGSPVTGRAAGSDVGYYCDTTNGSSGSPVLSGETHKVVALHHFGGCQNSGGRSDLILGEIGWQIDSCSNGGGDPPVCGNNTKETGEECDGADLGGSTCQDLGFDDGTLACDGSCSFDTSGCFNNDPPTCSLAQKGESCGVDADCCSNKCRGRRGRKTCK